MRLVKGVSLLCMVVLMLAGCAQTGIGKHGSVSAANFIQANYKASESLQSQLASRAGGNSTLLVATLVNIDALDRSSTLGRLVSEQVSASFTQGGYHMVEMKFQNSVYMARGQGELMLTREVHELANIYSAEAVIVGTYGASKDYVLINLKVVEPATNHVLAVYDYSLPMDENVRLMLRDRR